MPRSRAIGNATPRHAVNLSVDANLLREAREYRLDLSATLERALVDPHGAFADTLRIF